MSLHDDRFDLEGEDDRFQVADHEETAAAVRDVLDEIAAATELAVAKLDRLGALQRITRTTPAQRLRLDTIQCDAATDARGNLIAFLKDEIKTRVEE